MHRHLTVLIGSLLLLSAAGCNSGDDGGSSDNTEAGGSIGDNENNRYELDAVGGIMFSHTGGLICKVVDGDLMMDFSIDASDGEYEYSAVFTGFDPSESEFDGVFTLVDRGGTTADGTIALRFGYGPAPDDFPGVVRAYGTFSGPITGTNGGAELIGSYACFLQDAEVGD